MKKISFVLTALLTGVLLNMSFAMENPILLADQGSFMAGGRVVTAPGVYNSDVPRDFAGETLHGDAAYVFWQKPVEAHKNALVFLHGYGQSGKTWETTPDGRDGFQNICLAQGWSTYVVDQPRRGKAGQSTVGTVLNAQPQDQLWYETFRIGRYPDVYDNATVPRDAESLSQFFHQMTPDTGAIDNNVVTEAMIEVMEKSGDGILITHSAGGAPGWLTAIKSSKVKAVVSLEPGTFPFPEGKVPKVEKTTSPFPSAGMSVPMADFLKLTTIPIVVYFGDNIPSGDIPVSNWGQDNWRVRLNLALKWQAVMKKYGGDVNVISLPDIGVKGNTHFLMADLNNREVAAVIFGWLHEKKLDN